MKRKRRLFLGLGFLAILAVAGLVWVASRASEFELIEIGMTRAEVEAILGPTDNYLPVLTSDGPWVPDVPRWSATWQTGTAFIDVGFDDSGRVSHKFMRNDSLLDKARRWLGL